MPIKAKRAKNLFQNEIFHEYAEFYLFMNEFFLFSNEFFSNISVIL